LHVLNPEFKHQSYQKKKKKKKSDIMYFLP
jgi:hypothetical protein